MAAVAEATDLEALRAQPWVAFGRRVYRRLQSGDRKRPWLADGLLAAAVLLVFGLMDVVHPIGPVRGGQVGGLPAWAEACLQLALAAPLLWRRRFPTAAFAVVAAVFTVQWGCDVWLRADIALFLALYSVARQAPLRHLAWAGAATVAALTPAVVRLSVVFSPLVAVFFLGSAAMAATAAGVALRIGTAHLDALRERAARLEVERDQRSRLAAAAERARIAREMHDIIGHNLAVIIGLADGGGYAAQSRPEHGREALQLIAGTGRQALDELRRMLDVLNKGSRGEDGLDERGAGEHGLDGSGAAAGREPGSPLSPQPGVADLEALCARVRAAGAAVSYRTAGDWEALDRGLQLAVYRIVQESLTNTLKHAGPGTRAQLAVAVDGARVRVRVEDSGPEREGGLPGIREAGASGDGEGRGLAGMRERAALYGGTVTAGRRPGGGWVVEAVLDRSPLASASAGEVAGAGAGAGAGAVS